MEADLRVPVIPERGRELDEEEGSSSVWLDPNRPPTPTSTSTGARVGVGVGLELADPAHVYFVYDLVVSDLAVLLLENGPAPALEPAASNGGGDRGDTHDHNHNLDSSVPTQLFALNVAVVSEAVGVATDAGRGRHPPRVQQARKSLQIGIDKDIDNSESSPLHRLHAPLVDNDHSSITSSGLSATSSATSSQGEQVVSERLWVSMLHDSCMNMS